ncbi:MAG: NAD-dependent protein deacylase [Phycisphaera sp.]|nr:MAG: NAD-dependent protein deacylase [Phycisphaera sp.]
MQHDQSESIQKAAKLLAEASAVVVLTGAGVSAESGISTFRDKDTGLWAKYDPMELAHIEAFHRDPELVTRWYHWRFTKCKDCLPNAGHKALVKLQKQIESRGSSFSLLTQNVDGLHQRAGSTNVSEIHGSILTWRCTETGTNYELDDIDFSSFPPLSNAGALLRPNVIWFGENLPEKELERAFTDSSGCDVFMSVGTSSLVQPAASLIELAKSNGASTIEVNLEATPISESVEVALFGKAGAVLPQLIDTLRR